MKFRLLAAAALSLVAGAAVAQPPGGGRGPGGFGLLEFDTNADGKVTKAEFDAAQRARFNAIDANKDGSATREEFQTARQKEAEAHKAEMVKTRFTALDTDKNGQLSQAEFAAGAPGRDGGMGGPHGRGDHGPRMAGGPPMDGMPRSPGRGGPGAPDGAGPQRAGPPDADSDGKVTFAEFSARGLEGFTRADANKNGTVTIAELQAMKPGRN